MKSKAPNTAAYQLRRKTKLNQSEFWQRIGITQSGGSRYEHGRAIPKPVALLLKLAYSADSIAHDALRRLRRKY